jgi:hypothetical protein
VEEVGVKEIMEVQEDPLEVQVLQVVTLVQLVIVAHQELVLVQHLSLEEQVETLHILVQEVQEVQEVVL